MDFEKQTVEKNNIKRIQIVDAALIIILAAVVYIIASGNDILETIVAFSERHEEWELDELLIVSIFLVVALVVFAFRRLNEVRDANDSLSHKNKALKKALSEIKRLRGILPICAECKRIRDDAGFWHQVELYIREHSEAQFSHSICPDCMRKLYPEFIDD